MIEIIIRLFAFLLNENIIFVVYSKFYTAGSHDK